MTYSSMLIWTQAIFSKERKQEGDRNMRDVDKFFDNIDIDEGRQKITTTFIIIMKTLI